MTANMFGQVDENSTRNLQWTIFWESLKCTIVQGEALKAESEQ